MNLWIFVKVVAVFTDVVQLKMKIIFCGIAGSWNIVGNVKDDSFNVELENVWKENQTKSKPEQKTVILKI